MIGAMLENDFHNNDDNTVKGQGAKYLGNGKHSKVARHVTRVQSSDIVEESNFMELLEKC